MIAVLGPNGAGKTTFVRAVATLLRPDSGTLHVLGHDVRREPERVRRLLGLAGQFAAVEPAMSGRENLEMVARLYGQARRTARASAQQVLEQLDLVEPADRLVRTYSGGMRRRLDLGASLVGRPRLLLLDEPTTGLDPRSRIELWDAIRALVEAGTDVLLTTQYLDEADQLAEPDRDRRPRPHDRRGDAGRAQAAGRRQRDRGAPPRPRSARRGRRGARPPRPRRRARSTRRTRRVTVGIDDAGDGLTAALAPLDAAGVEIDDIALRQPTLDEVFLALTGRSATDDEHEPSAARRGGRGLKQRKDDLDMTAIAQSLDRTDRTRNDRARLEHAHHHPPGGAPLPAGRRS